MRPAKKFQTEVQKLLKAHYPDFMEHDEAVLRLDKGEGYLPLVIEKQGDKIIVDHRYTQNGDQMYDPRMDFQIGADGLWYPIYFQTGVFAGRESVFYRDGKKYLAAREQREQAAFANQTWADNLRWQKWAQAAVTAKLPKAEVVENPPQPGRDGIQTQPAELSG